MIGVDRHERAVNKAVSQSKSLLTRVPVVTVLLFGGKYIVM